MADRAGKCPIRETEVKCTSISGGVQLFGEGLRACVLHASGVGMQVGVYLCGTWLKFREGDSQPAREAGESSPNPLPGLFIRDRVLAKH